MSIFERIKALFKKEEVPPAPVFFSSVFMRYITETDPSAPYYKERKLAAGFCDDALRIAGRRLQLSESLQNLQTDLAKCTKAAKLTEEESVQLTNLLDHYLHMSSERSGLYEQLTTFDKSLYEMTQLEDQAQEAASTLQDAEGYQRMLRHDIGELQGEKISLEDEQRLLVTAMNFVIKLSYAIAILFVLSIVVLSYFALARGVSVFLPAIGLFLMIASLTVVVFTFRRRASFELASNKMKRIRAVELLNRKNTLFAYYTNYLSYCYSKYKVRSSKMLATNLKDLDNYKRVIGRLDAARNAMRDSQAEIEEFMRVRGLKNDRGTLESFAKHANLKRDRLACNELSRKATEAETALTTLDARHEELWAKICALARMAPGRDGVQPIIQTYFDEVEKLISGESHDEPMEA
ncbi:MAG: hypothetical protein LBT59_12530 [Clostridiales bacterium]|jgi:hypothetical protein|nr:hypothetical protein [Clostridiales bacterium]